MVEASKEFVKKITDKYKLLTAEERHWITYQDESKIYYLRYSYIKLEIDYDDKYILGFYTPAYADYSEERIKYLEVTDDIFSDEWVEKELSTIQESWKSTIAYHAGDKKRRIKELEEQLANLKD